MITRAELGKELIEGTLPLAFEEYSLLEKIYPTIYKSEVSDYPAYSTGQDFLLNGDAHLDIEEETGAPEKPTLSKFVPNYSWMIANRLLTVSIPIGKTALQDLAKDSGIERFAAKTAPSIARMILRKIEEYHTNIFNYGTLAAGSVIFNNSVRGEAPGVTSMKDASGLFIYDGQPFFSASHPMAAASGTLSNYTASAALNVANLKAGILAFNSTNAKDNAGNNIKRRVDTLMVPPALEMTAKEILNSVNQPYVATNTINVLNSDWRLIINPNLTDTDAWFLGDSTMDGMLSIYHPDYPPTGTYAIPFALEWNYDSKNRIYYIDVDARFGAGVTNWRAWHCFNQASS